VTLVELVTLVTLVELVTLVALVVDVVEMDLAVATDEIEVVAVAGRAEAWLAAVLPAPDPETWSMGEEVFHAGDVGAVGAGVAVEGTEVAGKAVGAAAVTEAPA